MSKTLGVIYATALAAGAILLPGCRSAQPQPRTANTPTISAAPTTAPAADDILAVVNGIEIKRSQLEKPLIESYGLGMLLNLVQVELARQQLTRAGLHASPEDVQHERDRTLTRMFTDASKSDYDQLLDQFLRQQHLSRDEFDMVIETNAYLRKFAEPKLADQLTDEKVHAAFSQLYGEKRAVRDIELTNVLEASEAKRRMAAGESFERVAREMSLDRQTGALGGELPPFSAQSPNVPQAIKDAAFLSLQVGGVSDPLAIGGSTHLIKLVSIIPPKIVKYEDVKDSVREQLSEQWVEFAIKEFRNQLAQVALQTMQIRDPLLKAQWKAKLDEQSAKIQDRDSALAELNRQRQAAATRPGATAPTTTGTTTTPATPPVVERPPATMPGAAAPGNAPSSTTKP